MGSFDGTWKQCPSQSGYCSSIILAGDADTTGLIEVQEMATLLFYIYFFMSLMLRDAQTTTIENHHPRNHAMILLRG
ncbi:hypothetical protein SDJN03_11478, partial [Cucurbita argyrosperma subsp. sororia]